MFSRSEALYLKMALLHVRRRAGRSLLTAMMIALSLLGLLLMEGMYEGMMEQITRNTIKTGSGTVSIQHPLFRAEGDIAYRIDDPDPMLRTLAGVEGVHSSVVRLSQRGLIATAGYSQGATVVGVDLRGESAHARLENFMVEGNYTTDRNGALIGYRLARKLKVGVGKKVIVTFQDIHNEVVSAAFRIRGTVKTNNPSIDRSALLVDLSTLRSLGGVAGGTEIAVLGDEGGDPEALKTRIASALEGSGLAVYSYPDLYPSLYEGEALMQTYNAISSAFIFIVASLGIFGVVLVSVLERVREFGIMMAIGTRFRDVARLIVYESLLITLSGYALGAAAGGVALGYLNRYGIDLSGLSDAFAIFGMDSNIHASFQLHYFTDALLSVVLATLLAVIIPIRTLRQRNPIQSINEHAT